MSNQNENNDRSNQSCLGTKSISQVHVKDKDLRDRFERQRFERSEDKLTCMTGSSD